MRTALVMAALLLGAARPASACSCVARSATAYFKGADLVFVGRAERPVNEGGRELQPITVLEALKGKPGAVYRHAHASGARSTCDRTFAPGEVSVVFVEKGKISICGGNYALEAQRAQLPELLRLGSAKTGGASLAAFFATFSSIKQYLHDRPRIPVHYAPLAGKSVKIGASTLAFVAAKSAGAIEIKGALERGRVTWIAGRYPTEGYHFEVLLGVGDKAMRVLKAWGHESKQ